MPSESFHVSFPIASLLEKSNSELEGILKVTVNDNPVSGEGIRSILEKDIAAGRTMLSTCDNRAPDGSCAGHKDK